MEGIRQIRGNAPDEEGDLFVHHVENLNKIMIRSMQETDPDESIRVYLRGMGERLRGTRTYVFERGRGESCDSTYEWCAPGTESVREQMQGILLDRSIWEEFASGRSITLTDVQRGSEEHPVLSALAARRQIHSLVLSPIIIEKRLCGFAGIDDPGEEFLQDGGSLCHMCANYIGVMLQHRNFLRQMVSSSRRDTLTGLYSFDYFMQKLGELAARGRSERARGSVAVLYFNIAHFQVVNRELGFSKGDEVLRHLGRVIRRAIGTDLVTRASADNYYAVAREEDAEKIMRQVHDTMAVQGEKSVEVRGGIYVLGDQDEAGVSIDRARLAAGHVEGDYRSYYRRYDPRMDQELKWNSYCTSHLDQAIREGWITVFYQPIVSSLSGKVSTCEALSRWDDPVYGFLSPAAFIEVLEHARLLHRLDLYVIERVCQDLQTALLSGENTPYVSVNLSRHDLEVEEIHEQINGILARHAIPHEMLHIEITESALLSNEEIMKEHIRRFHEDGYQVWLDDFGSGYSSLNTIQNYDFDLLKIDMLFLRSASTRTPRVLSDIIQMAKHLGIQTLTEGVETKDQETFMREIGCQFLQGYYYTKPCSWERCHRQMEGRGIGTESPADHIFYEHVGQVNVLDVENPLPGSKVAPEVPLSILEFSEGKVRTIYANRASVKNAQRMGYASVLESDAAVNTVGDSVNVAIMRCLRRSQQSGRTETWSYILEDRVMQLSFTPIFTMGGRSAFVMICMGLQLIQEQAQQQRDTVQDLYRLFDAVEVLLPDEDVLLHAYGASETPGSAQEPGLKNALRDFARSYVLPADQERFARFVDPDTLPGRLAAAPGHAINDFFYLRLGADDAAPQWKRIVLADTSNTSGAFARRRYTLCVARNTAGWTPQLIEMADGPEGIQRGGLRVETLWDTLVNDSQTCLFWKDAQGRFAGASQGFLNYYQRRLDDLLGKRIEETDLFPDAAAITWRERDLLEGRRETVNYRAESLVQGQLRRIAIHERPIQEGSRLTGLVGILLDETSQVQQVQQSRALHGIDPLTGALSGQGLLQELDLLEERYRTSGEDFGCVSISLLSARQYQFSYGREVYEHYLQKIVENLRHCVAERGGQTSSLYAGRFVILAPCADRSALQVLQEDIRLTLQGMVNIDGIPCTVQAVIGSALYSEGQGFEEMSLLSQSRMLSEWERLRGSGSRISYSYDVHTIVTQMQLYREFFDTVRLVDPVRRRTLSYNDQEELFDSAEPCYHYKGRDIPCEHCIAVQVLEDHRTRESIERAADGSRIYLFSKYVEVAGRAYVLDGMRRITPGLIDQLRGRCGQS